MTWDRDRKPDIAHSPLTGRYYFVEVWNTDGSAQTKYDVTEAIEKLLKDGPVSDPSPLQVSFDETLFKGNADLSVEEIIEKIDEAAAWFRKWKVRTENPEEAKPGLEVKLTYFKRSGKYYTEGEYRTLLEGLDDIWDEIKAMPQLPGLTHGFATAEFDVFVDVPEHPHAHPKILKAVQQ